MEDRIKKTLDSLNKNGFVTQYFDTSKEALEKIMNDIPNQSSVGIGGSVTIHQLGIYEKLIERGNSVYWHHECQPEEKKKILMYANSSDIYLSGTNAITMDGKLINIDGTGNRVANMVWGHEKIMIISGTNKITKNYEEGMKRIKTVACPQNAERLDFDVPCRYTGQCADCRSPQRMCNIVSVLERQPINGKIYIYLINENLGY